MQIWPGTAYPLGATYDGSGTNFALFSEVAGEGRAVPVRRRRHRDARRAARGRRLRLARFPARGRARPALRLPGPRPERPDDGLRCNPNKLLLDPYAKAIDGTIEWDESLFGYHFGDPDSRNDDDSAAHMPKCVVINPYFDWGVDRPPKRAVRRQRHLRDARQGHDADHPDCPRSCAARTPASRTR